MISGWVFLGFTNNPATNQAHMFPCHDNTKNVLFCRWATAVAEEQVMYYTIRKWTHLERHSIFIHWTRGVHNAISIAILCLDNRHKILCPAFKHFLSADNLYKYLLSILKCTLGVKVQIHAMSVQSSHNHHFNTYCCCWLQKYLLRHMYVRTVGLGIEL